MVLISDLPIVVDDLGLDFLLTQKRATLNCALRVQRKGDKTSACEAWALGLLAALLLFSLDTGQ